MAFVLRREEGEKVRAALLDEVRHPSRLGCVLQLQLSRAATQGAESGAHDADIRRLQAMVRRLLALAVLGC